MNNNQKLSFLGLGSLKTIFFIFILLVSSSSLGVQPVSKSKYEVCFTPGENCTQKIVDAISQAKQQILVQAYSFTSAPIAKALISAKQHGIDVKVILDKSQVSAKYASATFLTHYGIFPNIDYLPAIAHNKVILIDHMVTITGSFNFTKAAQEKNAENLLIINDPELEKKYEKNWYNRVNASISMNEYLNSYYKGNHRRGYGFN